MRIKMHPTLLMAIGYLGLVIAIALIVHRGFMAGTGLGEGMGPLIFGFGLEVVELTFWAFIRSPVAPQVLNVLKTWGFEGVIPQHPLEQALDIGMLALLGGAYYLDFLVTRDGSLQYGFKPQYATMVALIEIFIAELAANIGFWLLEDSKVMDSALGKAKAGMP